MAAARLRHEKPGQTLQVTAPVHETCRRRREYEKVVADDDKEACIDTENPNLVRLHAAAYESPREREKAAEQLQHTRPLNHGEHSDVVETN